MCIWKQCFNIVRTAGALVYAKHFYYALHTQTGSTCCGTMISKSLAQHQEGKASFAFTATVSPASLSIWGQERGAFVGITEMQTLFHAPGKFDPFLIIQKQMCVTGVVLHLSQRRNEGSRWTSLRRTFHKQGDTTEKELEEGPQMMYTECCWRKKNLTHCYVDEADIESIFSS